MKSDDKLRNKAIILYSGAYDKTEVEDLLDDRTFFIAKPFNLSDLESLLTKLDLDL